MSKSYLAYNEIRELIDQAQPSWHQTPTVDGVAWFNAGAEQYRNNLLRLLEENAQQGRNGGM